MAKLIVLLVFAPCVAVGQSLISIPTDQCRWHSGDYPTWSQPSLNDIDWQSMSNWEIRGNEPHYWVRCRADLRGISRADNPAIHLEVPAAFEMFLNGRRIGTNGDMRTGNFIVNDNASFALRPMDERQPALSVIAVRLTWRGVRDDHGQFRIIAGELNYIQDRLDSLALTQSKPRIPSAILFAVLAVLSFVLFGLFLNDRSRSDFLFLALVCWLLAMLRILEFCLAVRVPMSVKTNEAVYAIGQTAIAALAFFYSRLAGRRMPWIVRIAVALALVRPLQSFAALFMSAGHALRLNAFFSLANPYLLLPYCCIAAYPFFAFWPWSRIDQRRRLLAASAMLWGCVDFVWFSSVILSYTGPGGAAFYDHWNGFLLQMRAFTTCAVITMLLLLLFREQHDIREERALLAGEMHAAQRIHRMLAPRTIATVPGITVEIAFRPVREVGGDFYISSVLPGGKQRILVGDVSGKGAAAAMTAAMLIGAAQMRESDSPAALLAHLNAVLCRTKVGGFTTCLCTDIDQNHDSRLASAGHLAPYRNGEEIQLQPALPLGISLDAEYCTAEFGLEVGDRLTLLTDGVVEAQNDAGDLFGFERTREISTQSAEAIADIAQRYGQEDDITVLSITRFSIDS